MTTVRIVKDNKSQDGWIGRTAKNKVCFLYNIEDKIDQLAPGQVWTTDTVREEKRFLGVNLVELLLN